MTVTAACSCVNVELPTGKDPCSVTVLPDDEVIALSEYFQGNYEGNFDITRVRIVSIKVDCTISTSERPTSITPAVVSRIRLRACEQCESKLISSKTVRTAPTTRRKHETGTFANLSGQSVYSALDSDVQTVQISKFSDLLKSLFLSDSHGRCTITLAVKSDLPGNSLSNVRDVNENNGNLSTPGSCFSPLSQSVASVGRMKFGSSDMQTQLRASLYPAGISVGLLHLDAPLFPCDDVSTVLDNQGWGISLDDDIHQNSSLKDLPEIPKRSGILERSNQKRKNIKSPSRLIPSEWISGPRQHGQMPHTESQVLGPRGKSGSKCPESIDTENTNRTGNSRTSRTSASEDGPGSAYMKEREGRERRGTAKGIHSSISANSEKEKSSKRSKETADKLFTILNGRGREGKNSRLSLGASASGIPPKPSRRIDMKSLLRQSSAGAFEGLQLETVDPDFVFPGGKNTQSSSSSSTTSTGIVSAAVDRKLYTSPSISTSTTPTVVASTAITKTNLDLLRATESTDTDSVATASTVLLSTTNTDDLLYWKGQLKKGEGVDMSCPSTPSTVEDSQVGLDHGSELSTFAETYQRNSQLYEVMPQDDGSLFTGLGGAYGKGEFSVLAPPEESLAYSACSPSDTRTPDLLSPQGVAFFTRKLSGSKRASSLFGSMVSSFSSTVSSTFGIFSAVTNPSPLLCPVPAPVPVPVSSSEPVSGAFSALVVPSTSAPVPTLAPAPVTALVTGALSVPTAAQIVIPASGLVPSVRTLKSLEIEKEVHSADEMLIQDRSTLAALCVKKCASGTFLSLEGLNCDPILLTALTGLSKLKREIVAVILDCVVTRKIYVLDAALAVNNILKQNPKKISNKDSKKKVKKTDTNQVCQILEKITKKPLGGNLAVAQAVSSCCVLLVYILMEIEWGRIESNQGNNVKKDKAKIKEEKDAEKALRDSVNELIVSSFDRLAVATLSPFLGYDDVNWLTMSGTVGGKKSTADDVITTTLPAPVEQSLLSPRLRKRKAGVSLTDSPCSATRGLKKKRSFTDNTPVSSPPGLLPPRSKRDCLWDVVCALKVRYQGVSTVTSAFRKLTRNFRPIAGVAGELSESDSSPLKSPGVNSPAIGKNKKVKTSPDRFLELLANKGPRSNGLRRASSFTGRTQPMIPLSVAGAALLFSAPQDAQVQGPRPPLESNMSVNSKELSIGTGKSAGNSLKRTNSIVNVHKPSVGQRTGRGKGKSVRTSLKPDPNINSILSFTVPYGSSVLPRAGSPGAKSRQIKLNASKAAEREKPYRNDKRNHSSISNSSSSSSSSIAVSSKVPISSSDVISSGGSVRRSARKRAREDGDSWRNPPTPLTELVACDVNEVEDTPLHKVRVRKGSANLLASGMRALRGASPAVKGNARRPNDPHSRPLVGRDSTHAQEASSSQESVQHRGVVGAGIADSFASAVFGSGSSSRRNSVRRRVSIPFFLPEMCSEKDDYGAEVQTHSAGAALGMEINTESTSATKGRRSPRFLLHQNSTLIATSASNIPIEVELDRELPSSTGSFSRNAFTHSYNAPDSGKKVLQRRHSSAPMPSSPAPTFRLSMISTPPVQNTSRTRMGSPVVHRSMVDMHTRRSPRRHYSPV